MASDDKPELVEMAYKVKDTEIEEKEEEKGGLLEKLKDSIHDVGEKIEGAIGFGKPTVDVSGINIPYDNLNKEKIVIDVLVKDPNPVPIPETVKIPVNLVYVDIKATYHDIKPGSIKVDHIMDVQVFGRITIPLEKTREILIPYKPDIDVEKIKFERFSFEETITTLHFKIENNSDFDLGLKDLDYKVWLDDLSIGGADLEKS